MILEYLPINKNNIFKKPQKFTLSIRQEIFQINVSYNSFDQEFYFSMYRDVDGRPIIEGRKIVFGNDLLENIVDEAIPENVNIIVVNSTSEIDEFKVTKDNFMVEVKPYLIVGDTDA